MNSREAKDYDVVIVGGGPAGTSAAIRLASGGAHVLLAEQKKFPRPKLCGEFISPECLDHFAQLGVAPQMATASGAHLSETVFYTRNGKSVSIPSKWFGQDRARHPPADALGLSRAEMDQRLLWRARVVGVEVLEEAPATSLVIEEGRVRGVRLEIGDSGARVCRSRLTIDATGRARSLARRIEAPANAIRRRAALIAFKAHLENSRGSDTGCEIYFYRGGYGGLNPVEGGRSNLCFIASAQQVRACGSDPVRVMREIVSTNRRAAVSLADARPVTPWLSVALEGFGSQNPIPADGLLAVGDAASFIDPFTGSGILMALESGEMVAQTILRWLPRVSETASVAELARDYRARYDERFSARLRACAWLRRAAFAPHTIAEAAILALRASERLRRRVTRATRRPAALQT